MLRLTARYADLWNVDWRNQAAKFAGWTPRVDAACADVGRDPATLARTAAIMVDLPGSPGRPAKFEESLPLRGTPEEMAEELRAFARAGASHVQIWLDPNTVAGVEAFAPVLDLLDRGP
jgi:alkanesulfonate monooxygenase SsuD/methylene tetrahydromethanopterin reductase-like flavin-dependent oxidoreductase (luciferase family)